MKVYDMNNQVSYYAAKISHRFRKWRPTSQTDRKNWTTLKREVVKLFELNNFTFQSCSIFQSVWLVGRHLRTFFSTFWNFSPTKKMQKNNVRYGWSVVGWCRRREKMYGIYVINQYSGVWWWWKGSEEDKETITVDASWPTHWQACWVGHHFHL